MKNKWLICMTCLLLVSVMLFGSCKKPEETPTNDQQQQNSSSLQNLVPTVDMDREFVVLSDLGEMITYHDYTGDPIVDEEVKRTLYIEERFNVTMKTDWVQTVGQGVITLQQSEMAGGGDYDLMYPHPNEGVELLLTGQLLTDMGELQYLNLDREWYNQSQVKNYEANGKLYLVTSDISLPGQGLGSMICNLDLYRSMGFEEDLYAIFEAGEWTIDKLIRFVKESNTYSEGSANRTYGLSYQANSTTGMMFAMGQKVLQKNDDGLFEIALGGDNTERLVTMADKLSELLYETDGNVIMGETNVAGFPTSQHWLTFTGGRALFNNMDIGILYHNLRNLSFEICYLPLPKLYASDSHTASCGGGFFAIPKQAKNLEESSIIFESMSIYSYEHIRPTFFNTILQGRLSKNEKDYAMLEYIHSIKTFDFGFTLDMVNKIAQNALYKLVIDTNGEPNVTGYLRGQSGYFADLVEKANSIQ